MKSSMDAKVVPFPFNDLPNQLRVILPVSPSVKEPMKSTYDMFISHFQVISINSLGLQMKSAYSLFENNLTLFHLLL